MPHISRYNHIRRWRDGHYLAFNAATGAVGLMTGDNHAVYLQLTEKLSGREPAALSEAEQGLLTQLRHGGFVVEDAETERDQLKFRYREARYDTTALGLVVAPTMACNMACEYCFEANKVGRMSAKVVEGLIAFVEQRAPRLTDFQVTWYGGEPLLALDIIEDLAEAFKDLARQYKYPYGAGGMMTNGYLLTKEAVDRIVRLGLGDIQVTIDGPARIHDRKRRLKNGKETFATIMNNMAYACTQTKIILRVNVDKGTTEDDIRTLLTELEAAGLKNKVEINFGHLEPSTAACANIAENCHETMAFAQTEMSFQRLLVEHGFRMEKLPQPILTVCLAQRRDSFLVDSDGDLYRCFNYVGDKTKAFGSIFRDIDSQHKEFQRLFAFDPFEQASCRDCDVLPLCMGGCPARRADRLLDESQYCESWKYNLHPILELVAESRSQSAAASRPVQETQE